MRKPNAFCMGYVEISVNFLNVLDKGSSEIDACTIQLLIRIIVSRRRKSIWQMLLSNLNLFSRNGMKCATYISKNIKQKQRNSSLITNLTFILPYSTFYQVMFTIMAKFTKMQKKFFWKSERRVRQGFIKTTLVKSVKLCVKNRLKIIFQNFHFYK